MSVEGGPDIVNDGLVLYLDAGNTKSYPESGTVWKDLKKNRGNTTLINSPTFTDLGILFDGTNQYGVATSYPTFSLTTGNYCIDLWFRLKTLPTSQYGSNSQILLGQLGNNHTVFAYPAESGLSALGMCYDDSRYNTRHKSTKKVAADEWVNFCINGYASTLGDLEYYINGELDTARFTSADSNGSSFSSTYNFGRDTRWNVYTNMEMSIVKIYNRTLTADEIKQNYKATKGRYGL